MKRIITLVVFTVTAAICNAQVDPAKFGAKANGINDDTEALQLAIDYCIAMPQYSTQELILTGRYRITRTLKIGGYSIKAKDAFVSGTNIINQNLYDSKEYLKGARSAQLIIRGVGTTCIYADFESSELTPVISYQAAGDGRNTTSTLQWTASIENIGIYGRGCFNEAGLPLPRIAPNYKSNNQVAILAMYSMNIKLKNVYIRGFKEGIIINNCNFIFAENLKIDYCQRAGYEIQNHSGKFQNTTIWFCDKGFEVRSNQMIFDVYYAHSCGIGLHVAASNNLFNSIYLESSKTTESQLIIGDNAGDANAGSRTLSGIHFNMLTIVSMSPDNTPKEGIFWKDNARRMSINGGSIQNCTFKWSNNLTKTRYEGVSGSLPAVISTKTDL